MEELLLHNALRFGIECYEARSFYKAVAYRHGEEYCQAINWPQENGEFAKKIIVLNSDPHSDTLW